MTEPERAAALSILVVNWQDRENPQGGGAETHLHEVFGRLARWGHDVTLLASGFRGCQRRATLDGIHVHRTGGRHTFSLAAPAYYRRHLSQQGFDVVVEDLNKVPLFTPWWVDAPTVLLVHHLFGATAFRQASVPVALATWLLERPVPRVFRDVPTVAVSDSTARDLVRRGMERASITVIPNGVDLEYYTPPDDRDEGDGAAGVAGADHASPKPATGPTPLPGELSEPTLLFLGRLKRYKRVDLVLRAVARLRDEGVACRLLVVGRGDEAGALESLARRLELEDRVQFPGFVSRERKRELLQGAWIHVLTSAKEGWGITNVEAAACGTPTVASDVPGLRDSVVDGKTGYLVPHGDVDALADRIRRLVRHPGLRRRMGRAARGFAEGFSWDASARRMEAVLRERVAAG